LNFLEDGTKSLLVPIKDNTKKSKPYPTLPISHITSDRAQQTSPSEMFPINYDNTNNHNHDSQYQSSLSEDRQSQNSTTKQSNSDEHTSTLAIDDETELSHEIKTTATVNRPKQIPKIKYTNKNPTSVTKTGKSPTLKWNSLLNTRKYQHYISLRSSISTKGKKSFDFQLLACSVSFLYSCSTR
jgi:hypothetical protein